MTDDRDQNEIWEEAEATELRMMRESAPSQAISEIASCAPLATDGDLTVTFAGEEIVSIWVGPGDTASSIEGRIRDAISKRMDWRWLLR